MAPLLLILLLTQVAPPPAEVLLPKATGALPAGSVERIPIDAAGRSPLAPAAAQLAIGRASRPLFAVDARLVAGRVFGHFRPALLPAPAPVVFGVGNSKNTVGLMPVSLSARPMASEQAPIYAGLVAIGLTRSGVFLDGRKVLPVRCTLKGRPCPAGPRPDRANLSIAKAHYKGSKAQSYLLPKVRAALAAEVAAGRTRARLAVDSRTPYSVVVALIQTAKDAGIVDIGFERDWRPAKNVASITIRADARHGLQVSWVDPITGVRAAGALLPNLRVAAEHCQKEVGARDGFFVAGGAPCLAWPLPALHARLVGLELVVPGGLGAARVSLVVSPTVRWGAVMALVGATRCRRTKARPAGAAGWLSAPVVWRPDKAACVQLVPTLTLAPLATTGP